MAEYTDDDLEYGQYFVQSFGASARLASDAEFPIDDVEQEYDDFRSDLAAVALHGLEGVPAVQLEGMPAPTVIALRELIPTRIFGGPSTPIRMMMRHRLQRYSGFFLDPFDAQEAFFRLMAEFVAYRRAGLRELDEARNGVPLTMRALATGTVTPTSGCSFEVHTNSLGLRVHWSGAYRISGNYFGSPTSPTRSVLQSGVYVFGVDGGAYISTQWDLATKITLPGPHSKISLNY